jgi:hypothetical protein
MPSPIAVETRFDTAINVHMPSRKTSARFSTTIACMTILKNSAIT